MSVIEHLEELRYRIFVCLGAYVVLAVVAYFLYRPILNFMLHPLHHSGTIGRINGSKIQVYVGGIATGFILRMKTSAFAGLIFALPIILYQLWRFVTPGLEPRERKFAIPFVVSAVGLFVLGGYIAFLILPLGIHWLLGFVAPAQPLIQLTEYMSFVFLLILAFGISFEFPLLLVSLAGVGILSSRQLSKARRAAILIAFIIAAVATPSQDPISQIVMAVPLYILYELSIVVIRYGLKR
ncbi:MAG: twin-arginine translocase subunit TatC [Actinobacteria bacterium]|nr:MAG: twin-arginine translocase subunit TatC [Actinomycetota bacterium]